MGYEIAVWSSDYGIAATHIVGTEDNGTALNVVKYYGDSVFEKEGLQGTTTFTATPAASYKFKRWVYRIGGDAGDQQTSDQNPFYYNGADHGNAQLIIRAESENAWGGGDNTQWSVSDHQLGYVESYDYGEPVASFIISSKTIYRFECKFRTQGTARIYTSGYTDTIGYISTSKDFDASSGEPNFPDNCEGSGGYGDNFLLTSNVAADTTYYIWVRGTYNETVGETYLYIEAPEDIDEPDPDEPNPDDVWAIMEDDLVPYEPFHSAISGKTLYRFPVSFPDSGTAKFYSVSNIDLVGYVSESADYDDESGVPDDYIARNDDRNAATSDFYIEWEAAANTTYYLWLRGYSEDVSGEFRAYVEPPIPSKWSVTERDFGTVTGEKSPTANLVPKQVFRYAMTFTSGGEAKFYSYGTTDLCAFLSTSTEFDTSTGQPKSIDAQDDNGGYNGWNFSITHTVKANTPYYLYVRGAKGTEKAAIGFYIEPPEGATVVAKWDWTLSNGEASAEKTLAAHTAITGGGDVTDFSFLVWNDMCAKVAAILAVAGLTWDEKFATYNNTKMSKDDRTLTAARFNSLRYNIGSRQPTGIQDVSPEQDVLGRYFTTLASSINDWIDKL